MTRCPFCGGHFAVGMPEPRPATADELLNVPAPESPRNPTRCVFPIGMTLEQVERQYIEATIRAVNGNRSLAATILGLHRSTLYKKKPFVP